MPYKFTQDDCRKGGWKRAKQWAQKRRASPTPAERVIRNLVTELLPTGYTARWEYGITHLDGMPQWFDIAILCKENVVGAIEVDGSRDWHNEFCTSSKMYDLDCRKKQYCKDHGISLLDINIFTLDPNEVRRFIDSL